jgi:hypothetical protein
MKRVIGMSVVWTVTPYNVDSSSKIPAIRSQMLPDLAMARRVAIAFPVVHDIKLAMKPPYLLRALPSPCKHHGNNPCCVTSHLAKGHHKRVRAFDYLM